MRFVLFARESIISAWKLPNSTGTGPSTLKSIPTPMKVTVACSHFRCACSFSFRMRLCIIAVICRCSKNLCEFSTLLSKIVINPIAKIMAMFQPVVLIIWCNHVTLLSVESSAESWRRVGGKWPSSSVGFSLTDWLFKMYRSYLYRFHGIQLMVQVDDVWTNVSTLHRVHTQTWNRQNVGVPASVACSHTHTHTRTHAHIWKYSPCVL